jgi:1-acyl-sn-glycerol-3-phosphate acyltransferase
MTVQPFLSLNAQIQEDIHTLIRWCGLAWYLLGRVIVKIYASVVFRVDIRYKARIPGGVKILAANHPCTVDPFMLTTLIPEQISTLITEVLYKVPLCGPSLRFSGQIRVDFDNGRPSMEKALRFLKEGRTIGVFPEGGISPLEGGFKRAHTGMARLALSSGVPVIPVGISIDPARVRLLHSKVNGKLELGTWYLQGPYSITVGQPMVFLGDANDHERVRQVTAQIMQRIGELKQESADRLRSALTRPHRIRQPLRPAYWWNEVTVVFFASIRRLKWLLLDP